MPAKVNTARVDDNGTDSDRSCAMTKTHSGVAKTQDRDLHTSGFIIPESLDAPRCSSQAISHHPRTLHGFAQVSFEPYAQHHNSSRCSPRATQPTQPIITCATHADKTTMSCRRSGQLDLSVSARSLCQQGTHCDTTPPLNSPIARRSTSGLMKPMMKSKTPSYEATSTMHKNMFEPTITGHVSMVYEHVPFELLSPSP